MTRTTETMLAQQLQAQAESVESAPAFGTDEFWTWFDEFVLEVATSSRGDLHDLTKYGLDELRVVVGTGGPHTELVFDGVTSPYWRGFWGTDRASLAAGERAEEVARYLWDLAEEVAADKESEAQRRSI